jgi:hypothetical protein
MAASKIAEAARGGRSFVACPSSVQIRFDAA